MLNGGERVELSKPGSERSGAERRPGFFVFWGALQRLAHQDPGLRSGRCRSLRSELGLGARFSIIGAAHLPRRSSRSFEPLQLHALTASPFLSRLRLTSDMERG